MNSYSKNPAPRRGGVPDRNRRRKQSTGAVVGKTAGKVFLKILSYLVNIILTLLLICIISGAIVGGTLLFYINTYIDADISAFDYVKTTQSTVSGVYYMNWTDKAARIGTMVEMPDQAIYGAKYQMSVSYEDVPDYLWKAFVAIEDKRFFSHNGIDYYRTLGSVRDYIFSSGSGGGSTITQQLVKNITGDNDRTIQRKIQEWMRALKVEEKYSKEEILEMYLNNVPLSRGCVGVQAGAFTYFGKDVKDLTLVECAAIASITQKPTAYDPILNPENNKVRRQVVLELMLEQGWITRSEFDSAYNEDLVINYKGENNKDDQEKQTDGIRSWYTEAAYDEAKQLLVEHLGIQEATASQMLYTQGYKIVTAMDPNIQQILEDYYKNDSDKNYFPRVNESPIQPECSAVIIDHTTGDVVALIGGRGTKTANNLLNYATETQRSPGSSIKPLSVYSPAIDSKIVTYGTVIDDTPISFGDPVYNDSGELVGYSDMDGYPNNYSNTYRGLTTINYAVTNSLNTISVKTLQRLGVDQSFDFVKNKLHIDSFIDRLERSDGTVLTDKDISALALGGMNYGVTVLEMTAAYQIFPNKGVYNKPRIVLQILDAEDNVVVNNDPYSSAVISEQTASIMNILLTNVVTSGTAKWGINCNKTIPVAGKTGTTTMDNDRWFMGYTPYYVCGVWFGYSYPQSLAAFTESRSPALVVWNGIMTRVNQYCVDRGNATGYGVTSAFSVADGLVKATYCVDSGKLMTDACRADPRGYRGETGWFTADTVPTESCDCHVLVNYDKVYGGIAKSDCPADCIKQVGLLHITDRSFLTDIVVTDAEYTYLGPLPEGVLPGQTEFEPYYFNLIYPAGNYVGITGSHLTKQYNHSCLYTHVVTPEPEPEPVQVPDDGGQIVPSE